MALSTYSELQTAIATWLNRADLTANIPDFVTLCEAALRRRLRAKQVRVRSSIVLDTTGVFTLPSGVKEVVSLYLNGDTWKGPLDLLTPERVNLVRAQWGPTGVPMVAAVVNGVLVLGPVPDTDYDAEIVYDAEITPLATTPTSWLLTDYPDIYLYGSLIHSAPFLKDDERTALWQSLFDKALTELEQARDMAEFGANTPVVRRKSALGE